MWKSLEYFRRKHLQNFSGRHLEEQNNKINVNSVGVCYEVSEEKKDSIMNWVRSSFVHFGSLNRKAPHRFREWHIRKCGLVGVGMPLLEEMYLSSFLLVVDQDVELSYPSPAPCLPT